METIKFRMIEKPDGRSSLGINQRHHFEAITVGRTPIYSYTSRNENDARNGMRKWIATQGAEPEEVVTAPQHP